MYPHEPPKVHCLTKVRSNGRKGCRYRSSLTECGHTSRQIYHPNIDLEGNVCLNILREDWKPVLDINSVIYGLIYLFYEPNPDDPLNRGASRRGAQIRSLDSDH